MGTYKPLVYKPLQKRAKVTSSELSLKSHPLPPSFSCLSGNQEYGACRTVISVSLLGDLTQEDQLGEGGLEPGSMEDLPPSLAAYLHPGGLLRA